MFELDICFAVWYKSNKTVRTEEDVICKVNLNLEDACKGTRLSRNDINLEVGSVNTEFAFPTYQNVKEAAGTETKSCIGNTLGMKVNGSIFPNFFL